MNLYRRVMLCTGLLALPGIVFAHSLENGMNPFMSGFLHPILVPAHLICLIAIGLLLGQQQPNRNLLALKVYPIVILIGLIATKFAVTVKLEIAILTAAMSIGLLIAVSPRLPVVWCAIAAAFTGLAVSYDSAQQAQTVITKISALLGVGVGLVVVPLVAMEFADVFRTKTWQRISIRILGSWIAASAFLVLALLFRSAKP